MITLKDLFNLVKFDEVYKNINSWYKIKKSRKRDYKSVFDQIKSQPNITNPDNMILSIHFWGAENSDAFDNCVGYGYKKENLEEFYCLWFYNWTKLANSCLDDSIGSSKTNFVFIASIFLYEATWKGYSQEHIENEFQKMHSRALEGKPGTIVGNNFYEMVR